MPSNKDGMQPMQMQTSAGAGAAGISAKPIIIILCAVILGLISLVVGGGVAVYKVIQTHHMHSGTLEQLKAVESMVQQLKVRARASADHACCSSRCARQRASLPFICRECAGESRDRDAPSHDGTIDSVASACVCLCASFLLAGCACNCVCVCVCVVCVPLLHRPSSICSWTR